jgi:anthranilate phosphoribosyltransferase
LRRRIGSPPAPQIVVLKDLPVIESAQAKIIAGYDLTRGEAEAVMEQILTGRATTAQIGGFLLALRDKRETVEELTGFAAVMRRHAAPIVPPGYFAPDEILVDTCGTGGDVAGTFNISTAAAFVVAGAGVRVAKHGNRSISSRCGSADVIEALGGRVDLSASATARALREIGIAFLFAPAVHTAMKYAMPARREIRGRTAFNLLGPLTNPAGASAQVAGVFDASYTEILARVLGELGTRRAFVVHGDDGLDEISLSGETTVAELRDGEVRSYKLAPEDFGLRRAPLSEIQGGEARENAAIIRNILEGQTGPHRAIVEANAAATLVAAGSAHGFLDGVQRAAESIDSGAARAKLAALVAFAHEPPVA